MWSQELQARRARWWKQIATRKSSYLVISLTNPYSTSQYLETGLLLLYYVLPLFRGGPDSSQYIEKFNDSYQAVPVHMHQEDIAKHLAGFVVWGSAESEMD